MPVKVKGEVLGHLSSSSHIPSTLPNMPKNIYIYIYIWLLGMELDLYNRCSSNSKLISL